MSYGRIIPILCLLLSMIEYSVGQNSSSKSSTFCNRIFHSIVVVGETLYVDGGEIRSALDGLDKPEILIPSTVDTIDLSKPFTNNDTSIWHRISKNGTNQNAPTLNDGTIFASNSSLYLFGGGISVANPAIGAPTQVPPNAIWQYDMTSSRWSTAILGGSTTPQRMVLGLSAQSVSTSTGYYLGGAHPPAGDPEFWTIPKSTPYLDQGLLTFDEASTTFQNLSTSGLNQYGTAAAGFMNVIESIGTHGVLVAFGGTSNVVGKSQNLTIKDSQDLSLQWNLGSVSVYDVGNQVWYQQTTTGDVPRWRYHGCSVVVSAPDHSSHSIYVFGGWGNTYDNSDGGVYVLSIPSFTWIRVNQQSTIRSRHHCSVVGSNTMLVVGGVAPLDNFQVPDWTTKACDNGSLFEQGLGMFSLNDHSWSSSYDPKVGAEPYQIHASISKVIGGDVNGKASVQAPNSGFNQPALGTLLAPNPSANTTSENKKGTDKGGTMHLSTAAKIGIIAASVTTAMISLIGSVLFYTWRRQKRRTARAAELNGRMTAQAELSAQNFNAQKKLSELGAGMPPVELADREYQSMGKKIFMGRAELGDVRDWVYELGTPSVRNKSLPPTPRASRVGGTSISPTPGKGKSDDRW